MENAHAPTAMAEFIGRVAAGDGCPVSDVGRRDASPPHSAPRSLPALRGEAVFLRERCYTCHIINGQGVALKGAWVELTQFSDRPVAELVAFLWERRVRPSGERSIMPSYAHLPEGDLLALAHFIRRLSPHSKMPAIWQGEPQRPNWHQRDDFILMHGKDMERNPDLCWRCHRQWDGKDLGLRFYQGCHQTRLPE